MATGMRIQVSKDYNLLKYSDGNRPLDLAKHAKLRASMVKYGFLACFPIIVRRDKDGNLVIKDGQHRFAFAQELGLYFYFFVEEVDFDTAVIIDTAKGWTVRDFAQKWANVGRVDYQEGIDFADKHGLPLGMAFGLLAGTGTFSNVQTAFRVGDFKVKDRDWAIAVAGIYGPLVLLSREVKGARMLEACMAVCRVESFDSRRLLENAKRCRELLVSYSTREAYLDMLEKVYNYGRKQLVGLKAAALMAMRDRSPANGKEAK